MIIIRLLFSIGFFGIINVLYAQIIGCTDPLAINFNSNATKNDGSCIYNSASLSAENSFILSAVIEETSGLIYWNNFIWTHNDHDDKNLYALKLNDIENYQKFTLTEIININWEEVSQDNDYLYVGDFGNNSNGNRTNLKILRIEKKSLLSGSPVIDSISFVYSNQTDFSGTGANNTDFDCEAFIVGTDNIYLFTKQWVTQKTGIYLLSKTPGNHIASLTATLNVQGLITGSVYLEHQRLIALCGYSTLLQPFIFLLYDFLENDFTNGNKRKIDLALPFHQVEGITTNNGLDYYCSNEKFVHSIVTIPQKLHTLDLSPYLGEYFNRIELRTEYYERNSAFKVFPNPTYNELLIENESKGNLINLEILNTYGQVVLTKHFIDKTLVFTGHLAPGFYLLKLDDGNTFAIKKIKKN